MRKISQQKKHSGKQLDIFSYAGIPEYGTLGRTEEGNITGAELISLLEEQRTRTGTILEEVVDYANLKESYRRVRQNGGIAGVDKMSVKDLGVWVVSNMERFCTSILEERYEVSPLLKVEIPKATGGMRTLGIPTVTDRLIQQAIHQKLNLYYDPLFSTSSYGFRPGRSAHQAILQAVEYIKSGREWVVDIDLEKFFDKINHDRLMQRLSKGIGDKRLLRLIRAYLQAGMLKNGLEEQRTAGSPQGGPLSPLLSNIVLDELDKELEKRGHCFCRYADDCNIYVKSRKAGERVMDSMVRYIEKKLKLKVNRAKSAVRHCSDSQFLGYTLLSGGNVRISDISISRFKEKVRTITKRNRGVSFSQVIEELNRAIIGWTNYFRLATKWLSTLREIDGWIRRKLRCYRLKQCGRKYSVYKFLRTLGIPENASWNVVMYSQGWWNMSSKQAVSKGMGIKWFFQQGLLSIHNRITG